MMKGGETPASVIFGSNRSGKGNGPLCLAEANRVYLLASLVKRKNRKVRINKGVNILKTKKKSIKQMTRAARVRSALQCPLTQ
jgi:hypothetical protein